MANHDSNRSTLAEHVHTETAHVACAHGKVAFLVRLESIFLIAIHDVIQKRVHHGAVDANVKKSLQCTVDTVNRRHTHAEVQVRRLAVHHFTQELFDPKFSHISLLQTFRGRVFLLLPDEI